MMISKLKTRWWQLKDFFNVHPEPWGNDPIWLYNIFQMGGERSATCENPFFQQKSPFLSVSSLRQWSVKELADALTTWWQHPKEWVEVGEVIFLWQPGWWFLGHVHIWRCKHLAGTKNVLEMREWSLLHGMREWNFPHSILVASQFFPKGWSFLLFGKVDSQLSIGKLPREITN